MPKQEKNIQHAKRPRPALTPEAREQQLIAAATNLAEQQLLDGTASSQVITHYLKLGSSREQREQQLLSKQEELMDAKIESLHSQKNIEELYKGALEALKSYSGKPQEDSDEY